MTRVPDLAAVDETLTANPWQALRQLTPARIALGRCGVSQPTAAHLEFQLAHAQARDAVHHALDVGLLSQEIEALGLPSLAVHSAAASREIYLQRPDLGRRLDAASRTQLEKPASLDETPSASDLAFVVADGLSAFAVQRHAAALIAATIRRLREQDAAQPTGGWRLAPCVLVEQGRVAIGDEIGELLGTRIVVVLIGERPGLSSPDSLGIYLTWAPAPGRRDAERNCISNVRPQGLGIDAAAQRLVYLLGQARALQLSGVALKDNSEPAAALAVSAATTPVFLLGDT